MAYGSLKQEYFSAHLLAQTQEMRRSITFLRRNKVLALFLAMIITQKLFCAKKGKLFK